MDQCRFKKGRFFHVCLLLPMQADGKRILGVPRFEMANGVYVCMYVCMYAGRLILTLFGTTLRMQPKLASGGSF